MTQRPGSCLARNLDFGLAGAAELDGVANEVLEELRDLDGIDRQCGQSLSW